MGARRQCDKAHEFAFDPLGDAHATVDRFHRELVAGATASRDPFDQFADDQRQGEYIRPGGEVFTACCFGRGVAHPIERRLGGVGSTDRDTATARQEDRTRCQFAVHVATGVHGSHGFGASQREALGLFGRKAFANGIVQRRRCGSVCRC